MRDDCLRLQEEFSAYLDGEMATSERTALESHLGACEPCQRALRGLRDLVLDTTASSPEIPVPQDLSQRILERVAREPAAAASRAPLAFAPRRILPLAAAGLVAASVAAGFLLGPRDRDLEVASSREGSHAVGDFERQTRNAFDEGPTRASEVQEPLEWRQRQGQEQVRDRSAALPPAPATAAAPERGTDVPDVAEVETLRSILLGGEAREWGGEENGLTEASPGAARWVVAADPAQERSVLELLRTLESSGPDDAVREIGQWRKGAPEPVLRDEDCRRMSDAPEAHEESAATPGVSAERAQARAGLEALHNVAPSETGAEAGPLAYVEVDLEEAVWRTLQAELAARAGVKVLIAGGDGAGRGAAALRRSREEANRDRPAAGSRGMQGAEARSARIRIRLNVTDPDLAREILEAAGSPAGER